MASLNAEENVYTEIGNGYTNISFVKDEHDYGKINFNSNRTNGGGERVSTFYGKSRLVLVITLAIIVVTTSIVVPVAIVFSSNEGFHNDSTELDDYWSKWGTWTKCSATCGSGVRRRHRACTADISSMCKGEFMESETCWKNECFVYGKWTSWSSYGNCDVSCGGGIQRRTRTCSKTQFSDLDCVGSEFQERNCSDWECPDCNRTCNVGMLNSACDACICEKKNATGRVFYASTGNPVGGADIFYKTAQTKSIATSHVSGFFVIMNICTASDVLIKRNGFVDMEEKVEDKIMEIKLKRLDPPRLIQVPATKYRLQGEKVTLCCEGISNPPISYYEWLKDGILVDKVLHGNVSKFHLINLTTHDNGIYQCRANSESGAIMSPPAKLTVKEKPEEFCANALQPKSVELPFDCVQPGNRTTYEVGECVNTKCRTNGASNEETCGDSINSCCSIENAVLEKVNCSEYQLNLLVVKSCRCSSCESTRLRIRGFLKDFASNAYIPLGKILLNGNPITYANYEGYFQLSLLQPNSRITLRVEDNYLKQYLPATKVIDIIDGASGVLNIEILMIRIANPTLVDSSQEISLVSGTTSSNALKIQLTLPANSLYTANGNQYNGTAKARLTFLNSGNVSNLDIIPGRFQFVDEEGETDNLESLGVFNLYFEDLSGNSLVVGDVIDAFLSVDKILNATFFQDFKLWRLNPSTGIWEALPNDPKKRRRKRQTINTALWIGDINGFDLTKQTWYNYDKISQYSANTCYFKVRLYKDESLSESVIEPGRNVEIHQHEINNDILRSFYHESTDPENHCIDAKCDGQVTYISVFYHKNRVEVEELFARAPLSNATHYNISKDEKVLKIYETQPSDDGPFYKSQTVCLNSKIFQNHLRFSFVQRNIQPIVTDFVDYGSIANRSNPPLASFFAWYQMRYSHYPSCFIKINVRFLRPITLLPGEILRLRVFSYGGTYEKVRNELYGFNEENLSTNITNATFCINYKCSSNFELVSDAKDFTYVKVVLMYPMNEMNCEIVHQSVPLTTYNFQMNLTNEDQIGKSSGKFTFYAPDITDVSLGISPDIGLYYRISDDKELSQNASAKALCLSGGSGNESEVNDRRAAVTFQCDMINKAP